MKKHKLLTAIIFITIILVGIKTNGQVGINFSGASADSSAILDVASKHRGILIPRMTNAEILAITPVNGLLVYSTDDFAFYYYDNTQWSKISAGTPSGSQWTTLGTDIFYIDGVAIGNSSVDPSALLDVTSTSKGVLVPRMTQDDRLAITSPAQGLLVYQNDNTDGFYFYDGAVWRYLFNSALGILPVSQGGTGFGSITPGNVIYSGASSLSSSTNLTYSSSVLKVTGSSGTLNIDAGLINKVTNVSGLTNLNASHNIVLCNSGSAFIVNLPAAATNTGRIYTIKNIGVGTVTVKGNGIELIESANSTTLTTNKGFTIFCNGSKWLVVGAFGGTLPI